MNSHDNLNPLRRNLLHRELDALLDLLSIYKPDAPIAERTGQARVLLMSAARYAARVMGEAIVHDAYTRGEVEPDPLTALAHRLVTASAIFNPLDQTSDPASLTNAAAEVRALAAGDVPRLLRQRDPGKKFDYRLAWARLKALEWYEYLCAIALPKPEAKDFIAHAYGFEWDTISRWKKLVSPMLGNQQVNTSLRRARLSATNTVFTRLFLRVPDWKMALQLDGIDFQAELARSKPGEFGNISPQ